MYAVVNGVWTIHTHMVAFKLPVVIRARPAPTGNREGSPCQGHQKKGLHPQSQLLLQHTTQLFSPPPSTTLLHFSLCCWPVFFRLHLVDVALFSTRSTLCHLPNFLRSGRPVKKYRVKVALLRKKVAHIENVRQNHTLCTQSYYTPPQARRKKGMAG